MAGVRDVPLSDDELTAALAERPTWAVVDGKLHRELVFPGLRRRRSRS